jgi:hypothetical protein
MIGLEENRILAAFIHWRESAGLLAGYVKSGAGYTERLPAWTTLVLQRYFNRISRMDGGVSKQMQVLNLTGN